MRSSVSLAGSQNPDFLWRNGGLVPWAEATVHVNAVGHSSISSPFEGIKAYWNENQQQLYVFRLREHLQRLHESLRIVWLRCPYTTDELCAATLTLLRANQARADVYIRPYTFVKGIIREMTAPPNAEVETVIDTWPFRTNMLQERGGRIGVSSWQRISDNVMPPRAKVFSNYHNGRLALVEAKAKSMDWPLFLNAHGKVAEGPGACVAMVRHGKVITPPITSDVLESITRATILQLVPEVLGLPVIERDIDRTELYLADEMFFMGTGWEILPATQIDGLTIGDGRMGPITRALDRTYHDLVRGIDDRYSDWRTAVWDTEREHATQPATESRGDSV